MDTNSLSRETHNAIIVSAERFHHDLTLQFGIRADACSTDNEFIDKSEALIKHWLEEWDLDEAIADIFFENPPNKKEFRKILDKILQNIESVRKIPIGNRKFELW